MNVLPHFETAFELTQSVLYTTLPWIVILGDLLGPNLVLSFHSSFYLTSADVLTAARFLLESLSFLDHCDFLLFLSLLDHPCAASFMDCLLIWGPYKRQCFQDVLIVVLFDFKTIPFFFPEKLLVPVKATRSFFSSTLSGIRDTPIPSH